MLIYICDDSKPDRMRLVHNVQSYAKEAGALVTVQLFDSADALLSTYTAARRKPSIIFLDIYMEGTNGMEAAEKLISLGMENGLVFTTSSEQHAVKAFSIGADGYLHKPFTHEDFIRAMKRFRPLFLDSRRYITVQFKREDIRIYLSSVYYAESIGHGTVFCTDGGEVRTSAALSSYFAAFVDEPGFSICGRSYIVNLAAAVDFDQESGMMSFPDGSSITVPVRMRRSLRQQLREFQGAGED